MAPVDSVSLYVCYQLEVVNDLNWSWQESKRYFNYIYIVVQIKSARNRVQF